MRTFRAFTLKTNKGSYCSWGGRRAGAAGPGVQRVIAWYVPDGGGHRGVFRPALLRLQRLWKIHSTENYHTQASLQFDSNPSAINSETSYSTLFWSFEKQHRLPPVKLKELLGPKAENELAEWKFGLLAVSMGLHNPELTGRKIYTEYCIRVADFILNREPKFKTRGKK